MKTETKPFDPTKPCRTRDGREASIKHTFKDGRFLTIINDEIHIHLPSGYHRSASCADALDLVNIPEKKTIEFWVKIHRDGFSTSERQPEKDNATEILHFTREYEEGEGL